MCNAAKGRRHWNYFKKCNRKLCGHILLLLWGVLRVCASLVALEEGRCVHQQIMQSGLEPHVFVANSLVDIMQNVGAWKMLGVCSTRCHLKM
jgi:hypothetical protein